MDRDRRWDRTEVAYRTMAEAAGPRVERASDHLERSYEDGVTDEFVTPVVIDPQGAISPEDGIVTFNYRADRARQLVAALTDPAFPHFERTGGAFADLVAMTRYEDDFPHPVLFPPRRLDHVLGGVLAARGKTQLRVAETEKYAHVTYFFNGGVEAPLPGEDRDLIPSPQVATYDLQPEMSAREVTDALIARLEERAHDFVLVNYANADMVGHTGDLRAAVRSVEVVDACVGRLLERIVALGGVALVTRRPWQRRKDARRRRSAAHRAHDLSGGVLPGLPAGTTGGAGGRNAGRCGADGTRADGTAAAPGDDGTVAAPSPRSCGTRQVTALRIPGASLAGAFVRVVDRANARLGRVVSWLVFAMVLVGAYNAAARYLGRFIGVNLSSNLYLELQWYLFSLVFLLGGAYALRENAHVRVDVLYGRLGRRARATIDCIGVLLLLAPFCIFILWVSWPSVRNSWVVREGSPDPGGLPRYPLKAIILVAFVLLLVQACSELLKKLRLRGRGSPNTGGQDRAVDRAEAGL